MYLQWIIVSCLTCQAPATVNKGAGAGLTLVAQAASKRDKAKTQKAKGDALLKAGKREQALAAYRKAAKMDPSWYEPHEAVGNMMFASRKYLDAIKAFEKAIAVEPRYITGYYNIAFAYRKAKKYEQAADFYKKYIERKSSDPDAYYGLAATYEALGKIEKAVDNYLLYAEKEKRPSERQYVVKARNKARALRKSLGQEPEKPTASTATTAAGAPSKPPATANADPGDKPAGRPAMAGAKKDKPGQPVVKVDKPAGRPSVGDKTAGKEKKLAAMLADGDKAMRAKSYTRAMKAYFDAARLAPDNTEALFKLGKVYDVTGNRKAALLKWRRVLEIDPGHAEAKAAIAAAKAPRTDVAKAEPAPAPKPQPKPAPAPEPAPAPKPKTAAAAKAARPSGTSATANRVAMLVREGDEKFKQKSFSKAIAAYTHATQLEPDNEEALFKLAMAYAMSGNYKVAVFKWKKVLEINPNNESARRNIERARVKLGGKGGAKAAPPAATRAGKAPEKPVAAAAAGSFETLMARARQLKSQGDAKGVLRVVGQALKKNEKDAQAMLLRAEALVVLKRYGEAKRAFSKAMVIDPNLAAPFFGLAETCRLSGDKDRARYYFRMYVRSKAEDISPSKLKKAKAYLAK